MMLMQRLSRAITDTDADRDSNAGITFDSVVSAECVICSICALNTVAIQ